MKKENLILTVSALAFVTLTPSMGFTSVESTLMAIQNKLVGTIMPLAAIIGLVIAGISLATGNPSAKSHMWYAIIGAVVGFGAQSIVAFIRGMVG